MVDGSGRRFVDEAQNYNDLGRALLNFEPQSFCVPARPGLARLRRRLPARLPARPPRAGRARPGLAGAGGLRRRAGRGDRRAPAELEATVDRFNEGAARGEDPEHGRGSTAYDRFIGGLGPVDEAPYYALRVLPGCLGTKGGPRTDAHGRVLSIAAGEPIPRLYAAGNAAASPLGLAYPGAGGTLGPALVFGARAGRAAAEDA